VLAVVLCVVGTLVLGALCAGCGSSAPGTIGAALGQTRDHHLYVRSLPQGQGASNAGLVLDDEIVEIDGKAVSVMTPEEIRRAVRGDVGTSMVLKIRREGVEKEIKVTRSPLLDEPAKK
jgi:carboxyl-terminal processing protease